MRSPKLALLSALMGGALAMGVGLAAPANAATSVTPTDCFTAQQNLAADQNALGRARSADSVEDNPVTGSADFTPDTADGLVNTDTAAVNTDEGYVTALCGSTPVPTPTPTPTPRLLNCNQLAARGLVNIQVGSLFYRPALDAYGDGVACEATPAPQTVRVVHGKRCRFVNGAWVPVQQVTAPAPCPCDTPSPAPVAAAPPVVYAPAPVTIVQPAPAPVYAAPLAPTGAVDTGR